MCARADHGGSENHHLAGREFDLHAFSLWFSPERIRKLQRVRLCGNFGDPAIHPHCLEFCEFLRSTHPGLLISLNTNGSLREKSWWSRLGRLFQEPGNAIQFALDGLEDTHAIYRRGTDFHRILDNAHAAIRAGARAHWIFLVFEHNEHQVGEAQTLAKELGFIQFTAKSTKRFLRPQRMQLLSEYEVQSRTGEMLYSIRPARSPQYQNRAVARLAEAGEQREEALKVLGSTPIHCKSLHERSLYISAEGLVFPCCWTAGSIYPLHSKEPDGEVWTLLAQHGGKEGISLHHRSLEQIIEGDFYRALASSFTSNFPTRIGTCARICGAAFQTFEEQFQHVRFEEQQHAEAPIFAF